MTLRRRVTAALAAFVVLLTIGMSAASTANAAPTPPAQPQLCCLNAVYNPNPFAIRVFDENGAAGNLSQYRWSDSQFGWPRTIGVAWNALACIKIYRSPQGASTIKWVFWHQFNGPLNAMLDVQYNWYVLINRDVACT